MLGGFCFEQPRWHHPPAWAIQYAANFRLYHRRQRVAMTARYDTAFSRRDASEV